VSNEAKRDGLDLAEFFSGYEEARALFDVLRRARIPKAIRSASSSPRR